MQQTIAYLLGMAVLGMASPVKREEKMAFTVPLVSTGNTNVVAPAVALSNAIAKYKGTPPTVVQAAAAAAKQSGTVTATSIDGDEEYVCSVLVGATTMNLDFDTGSADLWVFSNLLPTSESKGHTLYQTSHGTLESGETWDISYGDGSGASGTVYADTVVIGKVTATSQAVEAATSVSSEFVEDTSSNGLVGLAFSSINTVSPNQVNTFFGNVESSLALPVFTADLKKGQGGSYDFGFINSTKYTGSITYVDVDSSEGYWGFTAGGYAVGSGSTVSSSFSAIADTGTTLLLLPSAAVTAYYDQVSGSSYSNSEGGYVFPCTATLPSFTAVIGGSKFVVPGSYINYAQVSSSSCYGGIQSDSGIGFSIFGDIFLKSQFVVFSMETSTPQLGFAAQ